MWLLASVFRVVDDNDDDGDCSMQNGSGGENDNNDCNTGRKLFEDVPAKIWYEFKLNIFGNMLFNEYEINSFSPLEKNSSM